MKKEFIVRQNDITDCGICCLESIIKYYNGFVPLETLRLDTKTNYTGTSAFNLINTAQKYGFNAFGRKIIDINDIKILPAIAHLELANGLTHFVVIYKITKSSIYIMDPAKGYKKEDKKTFLKNWTHVILIFKPYKTVPFIKQSNSIKSLFLAILNTEKDLIKKIIFTSAIITIFSIIISYYLKIILSSVENNYITSTIIIIIIFLVFHIYKIYLNHYRNNLLIYLNKNIDVKIILNFINHIFKLPLNIIKSRTSGEILTRIKELNNIKELFSEILVTLFIDMSLVICSIYFLYTINNKLFFILCIICLIYMIVGSVFGPIIYKKLNDNIDIETEFNSDLVEKVDSIESIKYLNITNKITNDIGNKYIKYLKNSFNYSIFINKFEAIKSSIHEIGLFLITSMGIYFITTNDLQLLSLLTFDSLLYYFINPIENCINLIPKFMLVKLSINNVNEFINIDDEKIGLKEQFVNGTIKFSNVSYSYDDYEYILKNFNINIPFKSHLTIQGHSGCGKSTLCKMLNRSIDDYKGIITINDINIKDYSINTLRSNILYVSQREKLFTASIKENILLGKKISKQKLNQILKITKVDEIIKNKSFRLESMLFDSGYNLSGGERQRIILARALIFNPEILILDESLSELDPEAEKNILLSLDKYLKDKTLIYISHSNHNYLKNRIEIG